MSKFALKSGIYVNRRLIMNVRLARDVGWDDVLSR